MIIFAMARFFISDLRREKIKTLSLYIFSFANIVIKFVVVVVTIIIAIPI
jgi:hypothetical protein